MHLSREGKCLFLSKKRGKLDLSKEMSADVEQLEESASSQEAGRNKEQVPRVYIRCDAVIDTLYINVHYDIDRPFFSKYVP